MKTAYSIEDKVFRFLRENAFLDPEDDVTVALSGGADSVALLWILRALTPKLGITLRAAHFHHGLRGAEADRDADFCAKLCAAWDIPFSLGRGDTAARAAETGESIEEAARNLRYANLHQVARGKLATAHNAGDNTETVLLHLLRGSGLRGMGGIPVRRENVIRPLLCCTREEIAALLAREGLPHVEDTTNAEDDCLRNRLRHRVLPLLRAENPNLDRTVGRTAALLREEDAFLSQLAARAGAECRTVGGWSCERLLALDAVLRRRVLLGMLAELELTDPALVYVAALDRLLSAGPSAQFALPGGRIAQRSYDMLSFSTATAPRTLPALLLQVPGCTELPDGLGRICCVVTKSSYLSKKNLTTFALKCDMIATLELCVRGRRPGDRLKLSGGTKSLKDLMIDRKIPSRQRQTIPVLTVAGKPVAVFGIGADPAWLAGDGEEALVISYSPAPACAAGNPDP